MKLLGSALFLLVVLAFVACAPAPEEVVVEEPDTTEADIAAIREVINSFYAARMAEDLEAEMNLFADDAEVHRAGQPVLIGKDEISPTFEESHVQFDMEFSFDSEDVLVSGDLGYLLNGYTLTRTDQNGEVRTFYGSTMWILQRQADGAWKITRYMWNNRPPAEQ